ncbi:MAG TPA: tetratricopeptide repeat protein [Thiobacillus sp.]|jgi:tetratricopeptide (TPR) repeat protein|nr:tetratricopeptide repeat protein [Thiobacillus sp.]
MKKYAWLIALLFAASSAFAEPTQLDASIVKLQHDWATAFYQTPEKEKKAAFEKLVKEAHEVTTANPGRAEPMIWEGIITSTLAKYQSIFSAGGTAKAARNLLLAAEKIDANALNGSALTSLGSLYYKVPRFGSFGDYDKAREYLERALEVNPHGIDPNFFMGELMVERGDRVKALEYFKKAQNAPARPGREDADTGRKAEIEAAIRKIEGK